MKGNAALLCDFRQKINAESEKKKMKRNEKSTSIAFFILSWSPEFSEYVFFLCARPLSVCRSNSSFEVAVARRIENSFRKHAHTQRGNQGKKKENTKSQLTTYEMANACATEGRSESVKETHCVGFRRLTVSQSSFMSSSSSLLLLPLPSLVCFVFHSNNDLFCRF